MKIRFIKLLCLLLAGLMLVLPLTACGNDGTATDTTAASTDQGAESDPVQSAIDTLRNDVDWEGKEFGILYVDDLGGYKEELEAMAEYSGNSSNAVINDAVFERNTLFEEYGDLQFVLLPTANSAFNSTMTNGIQSGTTDFYLCSQSAGDTAPASLSGYLYNYLELDIEYDHEWWDQGTLNFALDGRVFFMNGPFNIVDDDMTYVMMFNKELCASHGLPDMYQTVRDKEWTMEYMNSIISEFSADNGDGVWDDKDIYGLTATPALADGFFYGAGLKYVNSTPDMAMPELMLADKMERAMNVLSMARQIIHENNSTYMGIGLEIFIQNRALFGFEVVSYLRTLSATMETEYGVIPVPKFDKAQEQYVSRSNPIGSTLSIPTSTAQVDMDLFADTLELYCLLSQKLVKPAYYEVTLMVRNVQDVESAEMLDLIFSNRVYDMAAYFVDLGLSNIFYEATMGKADTFSSQYASASRGFDRKVEGLLRKLQKPTK